MAKRVKIKPRLRKRNEFTFSLEEFILAFDWVCKVHHPSKGPWPYKMMTHFRSEDVKRAIYTLWYSGNVIHPDAECGHE